MICYLVRHGKDDDALRGGWSQQPLTHEGIEQVQKLTKFIENNTMSIQHIYSSDLLRAMQTAQPIAEMLKQRVIPLPQFREVNNGVLAGMKNELAEKLYPGLFWNQLGWDEHYPDGESPKDFYERVMVAWDAFNKEILPQNENVLLVTHGGVIHVILSIINKQEYSNRVPCRRIGNTELIALKYTNGEWKEVEQCTT